MSESDILAKCSKTFPGIEKEGQYGFDELRASLKLSEKPTQLELGAATQAAQELMDEFQITGVNNVTKLALTARSCVDKIAYENKRKSDETFVNEIVEKLDLTMASGVLKHGSSKFTPVLELSGKPMFNGHPIVRPHDEWRPGYLTKREEKVLDALKKLPHIDADVVQAPEPNGYVSTSHNVIPKFHIGVRPK